MNPNTLFTKVEKRLFPETGSIQDLRERILRVMTIVLVVVGTPMLVANAPNFIDTNNWLFLGFGIFALIYLVTISFAYKGIPYIVRAISVVVVAYLLGPLSFENNGLVGDANLWLLFFNIFTTIMLGLRAGFIANIISLLTFMGFGSLITEGTLELRSVVGYDYSVDPGAWTTSGITIAFISLVLSISAGLLIRGLETGRETLETSFSETQLLTSKLEEEHNELEYRSQDLQRRVVQIRTAAEISRSLGTILNPQELLQHVADLIQTRFDLYYVGVFLVDDSRRFASLAAGTGEAGEKMITENHQLSVGGSSMIGWATTHGKPRISRDVGQENIRFRNPHLPLTRSELALPLTTGNQVIGAISVQSTQMNAFDEDDITILQSIADSLSIALENARLFQQFEKSLREIEQLNRQYMTDSWQNIWAENQEDDLSIEKGALPAGLNVNEYNIPLKLRGDQVIGNISLSTEQADFSPDEKEFIEAISNQAALALESARLLDEANKRVERERAIRELTTEFARALDFESLLHTIVEEIGQIPLVKETSIHITPPENLKHTAVD
jgi:GAF domain-containing protein